jgi:hypothetical protein
MPPKFKRFSGNEIVLDKFKPLADSSSSGSTLLSEGRNSVVPEKRANEDCDHENPIKRTITTVPRDSRKSVSRVDNVSGGISLTESETASQESEAEE